MKNYFGDFVAAGCKLLIIMTLCGAVTSCTSVLFQPVKQHFFTPDVVDVVYDDIYIYSDENLELHGWKLNARRGTERSSKGSVLFLHGNGENISTHFANLYWLTEHGYDGYIFDYRGYGKSGGLAEIDGVMRDVTAMLNYVVEHTADDKQLIVLGHSMGGALGIYALANYPHKQRITALVTAEAFSDYRHVVRDVLSRSWLTWLFQWPLSFTIDNTYSPRYVVGQLAPLPLLVMHSREDMVVDFYHAMRLYASANSPKQFIEINSDHNHIFNKEGNRVLLLEYLRKL